MTALEGLDLLRVLTGQATDRDDFASLTDEERTYLAQQLTRRRSD